MSVSVGESVSESVSVSMGRKADAMKGPDDRKSRENQYKIALICAITHKKAVYIPEKARKLRKTTKFEVKSAYNRNFVRKICRDAVFWS